MLLFRRTRLLLNYASGQSTYCKFKNYNGVQVDRISLFYKHPISQISTLPILLKEHTTKGWKYKARDGQIPAELPRNACEEGKDAIPHTVLVSELQKCSSVSSQIDTFCSMLSLTPKDIENRNAFCQSLEEPLSIYFPNFRITQFGSGTNGLGFKGCDADVSLQTFNDGDYVILKEIPSLSSVKNGTVSRETLSRMTPRYTLNFIAKILREHCPDVNKSILYINARVPILRFYNSKYDIFCDLSCEHKFSLLNTMLLRLLCNLDERFAILAKIIRYWGKYGGFVGDIENFNSYAFSLLVVHFLQTRSQPALPSIQEIIQKSEYLRKGNVADTLLLEKDLKIMSLSNNDKTTEELLREFFFYFSTFDFSRVMLLYSSSSIPKDLFKPKKTSEEKFEFGAVNIQDPFRHSFNVSGGASYESCKEFMFNVLLACQAYQNDALWTPQTENWGLCSIFDQHPGSVQ
ncbi:hypothetical protein JTE90_022022 [Oedothorax gibbosus]|uniref:Poly(A) RNA polymerase mitochondrial-like central palm domain-containing protein n=1 Tax=Oedothorax gibbosus TaxID=931172 RepID=A0AAV6V2X7_9ARAC|nr:hypothetical protein JTE90_022022 [Oedothorax gibbosus]